MLRFLLLMPLPSCSEESVQEGKRATAWVEVRSGRMGQGNRQSLKECTRLQSREVSRGLQKPGWLPSSTMLPGRCLSPVCRVPYLDHIISRSMVLSISPIASIFTEVETEAQGVEVSTLKQISKRTDMLNPALCDSGAAPPLWRPIHEVGSSCPSLAHSQE